MKILRSVTRRGFTVRTAGWFTVTSPNRWFAASQFREGVQSIAGQAKGSAAPVAKLEAFGHWDSQETTTPRIIIPDTPDHRLTRGGLVALAAIAITFVLLWWIARP